MPIPSKNIRAERIKGTLDASEFDVSGDLIINGDLTITGTTSISTITPRSTTASIFLTTEGNEVRSRTAAEVLTDIGAQAALTNPVTGTGTSGQVSFWTGTNSQSGDSGLIWDNVNKRFGIGASPDSSVLLDVRAQGASSTDTVFRVRNSTDTRNFLVVNGAGDVFNNGAGGVSSNTFFGENSGRNATGSYNVFVGLQAGRDNTTGQVNTFIGSLSGRDNTEGVNNTFIGASAGRSNTTGGSNTFVGQSVGLSLTTSSNNTAIGRAAIFPLTSGGSNVAIGSSAGRFFGNTFTNPLLISNNSVFLGVETSAAADNQTNQTVIGFRAIGLGSNTTVIGNSSTTLFRPYGNVAIGADTAGATLDVRAQGALSTDTAFRVRNSTDTGDFLVVNGAGDVFNNGAGGVNTNTFFGSNTGRSATGISNVFFGNNCGQNVTTGGYNTIMGNFAGTGITTQSSNTFIGRSSGANIADSNNTAIGADSGRYQSNGTNLTRSTNSVFLGRDTRALGNNQTNQIVIGDASRGLGSNTTVIGNSSTTLFRPYGNVAIGADTAGATLDVRAQGALSTDTAFRVRDNADNSNIISVLGNGILQHTSVFISRVSIPTDVYSFPTTLGETFKMMYSVKFGTDLGGGEYICVHDGTNINTIHTFPTEFGDTSGINFTFSISGGNIVVTANVTSGQWDIKLNIQIL